MRAAAGLELLGVLERAVAAPEQHPDRGHRAGAAVGGGEIGMAVAVEVADGHSDRDRVLLTRVLVPGRAVAVADSSDTWFR